MRPRRGVVRIDPRDAYRLRREGKGEPARPHAPEAARDGGRRVEHEAEKHPAATAGGAATGAVAGGVVGGPVGAVVGAITGAARGLIAADVFDDLREWWDRREGAKRGGGPRGGGGAAR